MDDTRNVIDRYKGWDIEAIVADLDAHGSPLEIALENTERDYNMGTIVRSANAFGVRRVHIVGRRQWNKRGAMMTDKYLHVHYFTSVDEFMKYIRTHDKRLVVIDNIDGSVPLQDADVTARDVLIFGAEGPGVSADMAAAADQIVAIEQQGSTRSLNVGVAAGIALYDWIRRIAR